MKALFLIGVSALSIYLYREGLWLMMMIVLSNIIWINSATIGSIIGHRGNYRLTHLLNIAICIFMVGGWWLLYNIIESDAHTNAETLIFIAGILLALTILMSVLPWSPDYFRKKEILLPLVISSQLMLGAACYYQQSWIGGAFFLAMIVVCLSYRRPQSDNI